MLILAIGSGGIAAGQDPPEPTERTPPLRTAAEYAGWAREHLEQGRWFERSAHLLRQAIQREPNNRDFHLAFGCALADRAASLGYTSGFVQALDKARRDLAKPTNTPSPEGPPDILFHTKDDNRPFRLTTAEVEKRVAELEKAARAEWDRAADLAKTDAERANITYVRGWGLWLLDRYRHYDPLPEERRTIPAEVMAAFAEATRLQPDNAVYWQSLGDAWADKNNQREAQRAYRRALALDPQKPSLWYRLYAWNTNNGSPFPSNRKELSPTTLVPDKNEGLEDLRRAAETDPNNALPQYELAYWKFKETRFSEILGNGIAGQDIRISLFAGSEHDAAREPAREAISRMECGNRAARYTPLVYRPSIPPLLQATWHYGDVQAIMRDFGFSARLRELARAACSYALVADKRHEPAEAERACRAAIGCGFKVAGDWPVRDNWAENQTVIMTMVGVAVASVGYDTLVKVLADDNNGTRLQRAQDEYEALKKRREFYNQLLQKMLARGNAASLIDMY